MLALSKNTLGNEDLGFWLYIFRNTFFSVKKHIIIITIILWYHKSYLSKIIKPFDTFF